MSGIIYDLLGDYSKQFIIRSASLVEFIFCVFLLTLPFQKKNGFGLKLGIITPFAFPLILLMSVINSLYPQLFSGIMNIFMYLFVLAALYLLYRETISELLLCLCGAVAIQVVVGRLYEILIIVLDKNPYETLSLFKEMVPLRDWALYYLIHFIFCTLLAFLFRRNRVYEHDRANKRLIIIFSLIFILVTVILNSVSRTFEGENNILDFIIRTFAILYALLTLLLRTRILETSKLKQDLLIMDELLYSEKKQFDSMRNEIEIINMKAHDLRQQLANISYKLTNQEVDSLKAAIEVYDTTIKTGSDILDVILYKKQLYCEKNQIRMSCMADGRCLSFISPTHLYSLLSNAIENALEAVQAVSNVNQRMISVSIGKENGVIGIHVTNYFNSDSSFKDQVPQTSKKDKNRHGFGIKSMRHIAKQYNGTLSFHSEEDVFYLHIYFPIS
ncbi:GHKL domain-containing protein [Fontibacillus panacisegetis]|uniref:GHKL domain-containing protein n=1 Tax=Fontibacillus panacisegetis TaxID=670482 RepID=A0A1G7IWY8_9BACL|nr:ATP-binding protein [Fontibacillus panacisegetis]SDF17096.1 GHKL domain-containing protein [Fontibacillus panacisegetis]